MALDVSKEDDKKVDTSFLQRKRIPKTKARSEVMSPFGEKEPEIPAPFEIIVETDTTPAAKAKSTIKKQKKVTISKPTLEYSDVALSGEEIKKIVSKVGIQKSIYAILLLSKANNKQIRISQNECAELFSIKSTKNAKLILSTLENANLIVKIEKADPKTGVSALYKFTL